MPVHLRVHSYYSFLRGTSSPEHLAQAAAGCGMPALALTDHAHLTGAIEFHEACQSAGVRPLLGLELKVSLPEVASPAEPRPQNGAQAHHLALALLAMDMQGWGNLCRLSSALLGEPAAIASDSLPYERLADANAGLICLTGDLRLANPHNDERQLLLLLQRLSEVFPERLYIELQRQTEADLAHTQRLASLAKRMRLPIVATHDIYTLKPEQAELQRVISAIRLNRKLDDLPAEALAPPQVSFLDPAGMGALFADLPQALDATLEVAGRCQLRLPLDQPRFPQVHPPGDLSPTQALRQMAYSGAERLYGRVDDAIRTRLEHELGIIEEKGYTPLFLIMQDILGFARRADIPTASRGSASSSLVAHCLGITTPDPLRLDLYFERFLNPARATPPDIDTDLCSRRRDDVIRYVVAAYGEDRVAMVGTINRFRSRSALREVAKAYGLPVAEVNKLVDALPYRGWGPSRGGAQARSSPYAELEERYRAPRYQAIFRHALALREAPHHLSIHAGGLVISPGPMNDLAPTMLSNKGIVITQFDLDSIERLGLVKIDLLGIRGLSVLGEVAEGLSKKSPPPAPKRLEVLEAIPQDDAATAQAVRAGRTIGCFQIESPGMRTTLREIQASSVDDILVALALYRPGPLTGGLKDAFVRRHLGQEPVAHLHPALGSLLADTYGVILYQEQVLRIAHELAGFSLAEADLLRRAMSHFDPGKQMQTLKEAFLNGAARKHAMPAETAERIWELMAAFAGYGFPKAHAASYAQVAWRSAWCKTHHPAEFMTAVLANWGGYYSQRVYLTEARRLGLALRPPHVNHSQPEFSVSYAAEQPVLYMGLDQVRDLTRRTQQRILRERPFHSFEDFLARADPRPGEAQNLVQVGALHGMGAISALLRRLASGRPQRTQLPLFALTENQPAAPESAEDWTPTEKAAYQEALLGVSVDFHPLELVAEKLAQQNTLTTVDAAGRIGKRVRVAGVRQTWRRAATARGDFIYFMTLEDLEGMLNVIISSQVYRRSRADLSGGAPLVVEGTIELEEEALEPHLRAEAIWRVV